MIVPRVVPAGGAIIVWYLREPCVLKELLPTPTSSARLSLALRRLIGSPIYARRHQVVDSWLSDSRGLAEVFPAFRVGAKVSLRAPESGCGSIIGS
uniref:Uncharacterized protein n=1 Tax=Mycena chlorophos TaxID=658473 RepID=A0ABQ0LFS5_MYCCL|nr:predicted protein [Mycena chlorophos]